MLLPITVVEFIVFNLFLATSLPLASLLDTFFFDTFLLVKKVVLQELRARVLEKKYVSEVMCPNNVN